MPGAGGGKESVDVGLVLWKAKNLWNIERDDIMSSCEGKQTLTGVVNAVLETVGIKHLNAMSKDKELGNTILHWAARENKVHILGAFPESALLKPHINADNKDGWTPLHLSSSMGLLAVVKKLVEYGANLMDPTHDRVGALPFHLAAETGNQEVMEEITKLTGSADIVNKKATDGRTALHFAVKQKQTAAVEWLLKQNASMEEKDELGNTPLHYAAFNSSGLAIVQLLIQGIKSPSMGSRNREDVTVSLVNACNNLGRTPLHFAAWAGLQEISEKLLAAGADKHPPDHYGTLPFHLAAVKGKPQLLEALVVTAQTDQAAARSGKLTEVSAEITGLMDAHVNEKTKKGRSALHFAVKHGNVDAVEWLLERKASVDAQDNNGNTPLHDAVRNFEERTKVAMNKIMKLLVKSGAPLCKCNKEVMMPVSYGRNMIVTLLYPSSSAPEAMTIDVAVKDKNGKSILHYAAEGANSKARMEWLLKKYATGCNMHHALALDNQGSNPLHHAAEAGNEKTATVLLDHVGQSASNDKDKLLNAINKAKMTPTLCALLEKKPKVLEHLLKNDTSLSLSSINTALYNHMPETDQSKLDMKAGREACSFLQSFDFLTKGCRETEEKCPEILLPTYLALHTAGKDHVYDFLLTRGNMHVNSVDEKHQRTCLHWATVFGRTDVVKRLLGNADLKDNAKDERTKQLLNLKVNAKDKHGKTALQYAVEGRHTEIQHELLKRKDVN